MKVVVGRRAARAARVRRQGRRAGAARAVGLPVGRHRRAHDRRQAALQEGRAGDHPDGARAGHQGRTSARGRKQLQDVGLHDVPTPKYLAASRQRASSAVSRRRRVRFERITKRFPGVQALRDVSLEIAAGSCHALCGENGAGKSTLGKILAGIYAPDDGTLFVDGAEVHFASPRDALAAGVGMVHQELAFCDNLSVAENLCLGALADAPRLVDRARRWNRARHGDARRDRRDARRRAPRRRADDRAAADGADRRGRRRRRADHRVRRADEQPEPGRRGAAVRADRPAQAARRDVHLRVAPHAGGLSAVRHVSVLRDGAHVGDAPVARTRRGASSCS